jgi:tRNA modification GTPase
MFNPTACHIVQLTPPGRGAIATLRVEGPGAVAAVESHFRSRSGRPLAASPVDRLTVGHFGGDNGEEIVVRRCADGAVELHCHGGLAAIATIEETLLAAGGNTLAWRDWAAGHHADPIAAAALTALADARTERTAAILLDQYHGALQRALDESRQAIDRGDRDTARRQVDALLERAELGRHLVQPWRVVLAGRVNVGKSSLINCMAGYGRSIVHPSPGTTRDAVTLTIAIDGWPIELCDTAGFRAGGDAIERAGIERACQRLAQADLVILVFDQSEAWSAEDQTLVEKWAGALLIHNKCDLPAAAGHRPSGMPTSALRAEGISGLLDAIAGRLVPNAPPSGAAVPFTDEQIEMVRSFVRNIGRVT